MGGGAAKPTVVDVSAKYVTDDEPLKPAKPVQVNEAPISVKAIETLPPPKTVTTEPPPPAAGAEPQADIFACVPQAPLDPIFGSTVACRNDPNPNKIDVGVGAYRAADGKPYVLNVVKEAEEEILKELGTGHFKEYSTIDGPALLKRLTVDLCFDNPDPSFTDRVASVQTLSGTGALRVVAEFAVEQLPPASHEIYVSDPTWNNHLSIFKRGGLTVKKYPYWDDRTKDLNFEGMMETLNKAPEGAMVLLHACAHNPTGCDPTEEQWEKIAQLVKARKLVTLMDSAYQGYASGDLEKDAFAIRLFAKQNIPFFLCQSFAKNLGLYGERVGMIHVLCNTPAQAEAVTSQLKRVIRPMYSSPPIHGGLIVMKILSDEDRKARWKEELRGMAERIKEMRDLLRKGLEAKGTPGTWEHITKQIGMFSFTGIGKPECEKLINTYSIYLMKNGRTSMAGLTHANIQYFIDCVDQVVREFQTEKLPASAA